MSEKPPAPGDEEPDNMARPLPRLTIKLQSRGQWGEGLSVDKLGDNVEHCQLETVGVTK